VQPPGDTFWGMAIPKDAGPAKGHNTLGKLIMQVRWENRMLAHTREEKS